MPNDKSLSEEEIDEAIQGLLDKGLIEKVMIDGEEHYVLKSVEIIDPKLLN